MKSHATDYIIAFYTELYPNHTENTLKGVNMIHFCLSEHGSNQTKTNFMHTTSTGGLMVKTPAPDLELLGLSPTSVRAFFSFPLFNFLALEFT